MARKNDTDKYVQNPDLIINKPLEEVIHNSIMPYAEYVILERAIPRVEDGLKPVQRRILYTMSELGVTPDKPHKKSARIVGDTLGKYHPHGDTSVYDAMVRMAQDFNMRYLLIDGHGNFGSIDGDSAAAMRYTEARLSPLAMEILRDLDKDTVSFSLNFDDSLKEPDVLPGRFPNLLANGASGIAVGLATNIPPHNLMEVIDGTIAVMENPDIALSQLMDIIKGPDFPTGGIIVGEEEIEKAYKTGKGKITIRAKVEVEELKGGKKQLVIKELPYQVNKANLLEKILKLSDDDKKGILSGISDIRDESDKNGIRAVIELKKDVDEEKVLNYLYKYSDLQITFGINMVAIADGKPQQMGLKTILQYYINHQKDVVTRKTRFELDKAKTRAHILEGLIKAIDNIDRVIAIIRSSKNPKEAKIRLMEEFELTEIQAQAILDMRLQRLTNLEIITLQKEYAQTCKLIERLTKILESEALLIKEIKKDLLEIREKYSDERRTEIISDSAEADIKAEDFIIVEDVIITLSKNQDIKRVPFKSYNRSKDAGNNDDKDTDFIEFMVESATNHRVLFFTESGSCYGINGLDIPEGKWKDKGVPLATIINGFEVGEKIVGVVSVGNFDDEKYLQFYTQNGMIKRTVLSEYNSRITKINACNLKDGDKVIKAELTDGVSDVILITQHGMSIRFHGTEISDTGRATSGVKAIQLKRDDKVISAYQVDDEGELVVITDRGFVKRTLLSDYEPQGRGGIGFKTITFNKNHSNGSKLVGVHYVKEPFDIRIVQKDGTVTSLNTEALAIQPRAGKGQAMIMVVLDNEVENTYRYYG